MKTLKHIRIYLSSAAFLCLGTMAMAQSGGGLAEDINLENEYKPNLQQLNKPRVETPPIVNEAKTEDVEYQETKEVASTSYEPLKPKAEKPPKETFEKLYNNFLKVGFGRFASPIGELYLNSGRNLNGNVGLDFSHYSSSNGWVDYAEERDDKGGIKAEYYANGHTLRGSMRLQNTNYFYYADPMVEGRPDLKDSIRQTFTRLELATSVAKNFKPDELVYDVGLNFKGYFDRYQNRDLHFALLPELGWKITDDFRADIRSNFTFSNSVFDTLNNSRFFLDFTPTVSFQKDRFQAEAGLRVNSLADTSTSFAAFPLLNASYQVVEGKLTAKAGLDGQMHYLQYYNLVAENRYLDRYPDLRPMNDRFVLYLGLDGSISRTLSFSARGYTKKVKNQLIYFAPEDSAYFAMVYDSNFAQTGAELALSFNKDDKIRAGIKGDFRSFKTSNIAYNFNIPGVKVDIWASYKFADKVWVASEIYVYGGRVMTLDVAGNPIRQGVVADVNLSADYRFNKRISLFLELNNLLSNNWQRWYNYQERPFDVRAGVTLSF